MATLGMYRLKIAAITYNPVTTAMANSGGVSMPVSMPGMSKAFINGMAILGVIMKPPMTAPRMIAATVSPSIQPLASTSLPGGRYSVRMPYLAGE